MRKERRSASSAERGVSGRACSDKRLGSKRGMVADNGVGVQHINADKKDVPDGRISNEPAEEAKILDIFAGGENRESRPKDDDNALSFDTGETIQSGVGQIRGFGNTSGMKG